LGILFSSILCTCPNQHNLCSCIVSVMIGFLTTTKACVLKLVIDARDMHLARYS
jgi:hypothetical protein